MATKGKITCPNCGQQIKLHTNPVPTADAIIEVYDQGEFLGIVLIERKNEPLGWAIPGGFVEYGETVEHTAVREAKEETDLDVKLQYLLGVYSNPNRDPRQHTISMVFVARAEGQPKAGSDAKGIKIVQPDQLPDQLAFDHKEILLNYIEKIWKKTNREILQ